jgi:hypothetical protein
MLRTAVLPALMALVGVVIVVQAFVMDGGPAVTRLLIGVLFVAAGGLRLYAEHR